jgi:hypothetical protein
MSNKKKKQQEDLTDAYSLYQQCLTKGISEHLAWKAAVRLLICLEYASKPLKIKSNSVQYL